MAYFDAILLTCEHGGNRVPASCRAAFAGQRDLLRSHRAYDDGALATASFLSRRLGAPLIASTVTRLVVDLNRPENEPSVFSAITRTRAATERERLLETFHRPHWRTVFARVEALAQRSRLLHLACHSFTPVLDGRVRETDLGLLYDPSRSAEAQLCAAWVKALARALPDLRVHRNRPYRGWTPGLTTSLRDRFGARRYLGVEIEMGQGLDGADRRRVRRALVSTLREISGGERRSSR